MSLVAMMTKKLGVSFLILSTLSASGFASESLIPGARYQSAKAIAMGDAALGLVDDGASALFVNPLAGLKAKGFQAEPLNLTFQTNSGFVGNLGTSAYQVYSLSSYLPRLQDNPNVLQGGGMSVASSVVYKGFAAGFLTQARQYGSVNDADQVTYKSLYQMIPAASYATKLANGVIRLGWGVQWVNQAYGTVTTSVASASGYNQGIAAGSGLSNTGAVGITLPIAYLPSFQIVGRNLMGTQYSSSAPLMPVAKNSTGAPAPDVTTYDASFSLMPRLGSGVNMQLALVYKDASNRTHTLPWARASMGTEIGFKEFIFVRAGYGTGYTSLGSALRLKTGELGFAYYGEEFSSSFKGQKDQRYLIQFQLRV